MDVNTELEEKAWLHTCPQDVTTQRQLATAMNLGLYM